MTSEPGNLLRTMDTASARAPGYAAPYCRATGAATSARFAPDGYGLWLVAGRLEPGTKIEWSELHGDEGVYVVSGCLHVGSATCEAGGAVVLEAGAPAIVEAVEGTEVVHVGPVSWERLGRVGVRHGATGAPAVHVHSGDGLAPIEVGTTTHHYFADSTCPTCAIAFFRIDEHGDRYASPSHVHSQDEIIHVLSGSLQFGRQTVGAGVSVAIPAERRYAFRANAPFSFLNHRAGASTVTMAPGSRAFEETAAAVRRLAAKGQASHAS